tara:strand:+ start:26 stop:1588 length:1563 start_codon:yes stop_codon:yes gene_type:complete
MSLTKIGSIGINTGIQLAGVTTVSTLHVGSGVTLSSDGDVFATGISTFSEDVKVGSGVTISPDGDIFATGVTTSTTFVGNLTGNVTGNISGGTVAGSTGTFTGNVAVSGANITLQDSGGATDDRIVLGAGSDLSIYHDGSHSRIVDSGTGNLILQTNKININSADGSQGIIHGTAGGAVELYHNNTVHLTTDANGIHVTSNVHLPDSGVLELGDGSDLKLYHTAGSANFIQASGGHANIHISNLHQLKNQDNDEFMLQAANGGSVTLYHNNVNKFSTQSYGISVDGVVAAVKDSSDDETSGFQVNGAAMDSSGFNYIMSATNDTANCLTLFVNGSGRSTDGGANGLTIRNDSGPMAVGNGSQINTFHTGNGGGISFAATAGPTAGTASNEILDDYEEGSFTVGLSGSSPMTVGGSGTYVKIGRMVKAWVYLSFSGAAPNNSTGFVLTGFPYNADGANHGFGGITYTGAANYDVWRPLVQSSANNVYFHRVDGNSGTLLNSYVNANPITAMIFGVIYDTAA